MIDKQSRSFCPGPNDFTIERRVIAKMSFTRLNRKYHHNLHLIKEYTENLSNASINALTDEFFNQPVWIRTAAIEIKFIIDEMNFRIERDFSPYLSKTLNEIMERGRNGR